MIAESDGPGRGSEFSVRIPCLAENSRVRGSSAAAPPGRATRSVRVLVVDDNRDASESLGLILRRRDHALVVCHDGETALRAAEEQRPDVVLLDLGLPGIDGFEVCRRLRQSGHDRAFVVAITGYGQDEDQRRSRAAGFDAHLVKPVDPDALVELVENCTAAAAT